MEEKLDVAFLENRGFANLCKLHQEIRTYNNEKVRFVGIVYSWYCTPRLFAYHDTTISTKKNIKNNIITQAFCFINKKKTKKKQAKKEKEERQQKLIEEMSAPRSTEPMRCTHSLGELSPISEDSFLAHSADNLPTRLKQSNIIVADQSVVPSQSDSKISLGLK